MIEKYYDGAIEQVCSRIWEQWKRTIFSQIQWTIFRRKLNVQSSLRKMRHFRTGT